MAASPDRRFQNKFFREDELKVKDFGRLKIVVIDNSFLELSIIDVNTWTMFKRVDRATTENFVYFGLCVFD